MRSATPRRRFALDHNFPEPILSGLAAAIPMAELVPVRFIEAHITELDDWELLLALHQHELHWDGLVTNDANMLALPREVTVLAQTRLTLVVIRGDGDSAVRATGALLCHLPFICRHTTPERAQVWRLRTAQKNYDEVTIYLDQIAARHGKTAEALFEEYKLSPAQLAGR